MHGFKTTPFGFSKQDVTKFIKELSDNYTKNLKEKDEEIAALKLKIDELTEKLPQKELDDADK